MSGDLCHFFQLAAIETWRKIAAATQVGFPYGEESITERILLDLHLRFPKQVKIWPHNKQTVEPKTGADWEWWIGRPGEWFGMRVQAKRIHLPREDYGTIKTYKTKSQPKTQIRTLIEQSRLYGVTPLYCLYTYSAAFPSPLPNCIPSLSRREVNGCLIGHAANIASAPGNRLLDFAPTLVPWHMLVCDCADFLHGHNPGWRAQNAVRQSLDWAQDVDPDRADGRPSGEFDKVEPFVSPVEVSLPPALMDFLGTSGSADFLSGYAEERDLAGVMILQP